METDFTRNTQQLSTKPRPPQQRWLPSGLHGSDSREVAHRDGSPGRSLAKWLGWFSVGLGAAELIAPRGLARLIGLRPTGTTTTVLRALGGREIANGLGILANPSSKEWVGMRVGGDLIDLALLGVALAKSERPARTLAAAIAVVGVTALDAAGAERLAEERKVPVAADADSDGVPVVRSITVERPLDEVYAFWSDFANFPRFMAHVESVDILDERRSRWRATGSAGTHAEWESEIVAQRQNELIAWRTVDGSDLYHSGEVRFHRNDANATVVTVQLAYSPPGGRIAAAALKLFRKEPGQQVIDDLRRFKQILETGEVLLSDSSTARTPRPARPPEGSPQVNSYAETAQEVEP